MASNSKRSSKDSAARPVQVGGGECADRPRKETAPGAVATTGDSAEKDQTLEPAPAVEGQELATVDKEAAALVVEQPATGVGCRMPYESYRSIVLLLKEGVPLVKLADRFNVSRSTIQMLKERHSDIIPSHRDMMAGKSERLREVLSDQMLDAVSSGRMSPNQYAFTYSVVSDKYLAETGQNTTKHAHIHVNVGESDLSGLLSGLSGDKADSDSGSSREKPPKNSVDV